MVGEDVWSRGELVDGFCDDGCLPWYQYHQKRMGKDSDDAEVDEMKWEQCRWYFLMMMMLSREVAMSHH